jgi:CrcB protein
MFKYVVLIGTGGFIGSVLRFYVSRLVQDFFLSSFPYGTSVVNVIGCLLIGFIYGIAEKGTWLTPEWRIFLTVGLCGGFTTFSTFSSENFQLLRDGQFIQAILYTSSSVLLGFLAVYSGYVISKLT